MAKFTSMPNFRRVESNPSHLNDKSGNKPEKLYRSSRPDFLDKEELDSFKELGIKTIIDFRSAKEYKKASGVKVIDRDFPVFKVKLPFTGRYKPKEKLQFTRLVTKNSVVQSDKSAQVTDFTRKHFLLNFFNLNYVWAVYNRAPWYMRLYSLLFLLLDVILNTGYKYFVRCYATNVLNKEGLLGQYFDMITYSQSAICAALKLLSEPENIPAMLNCAHGKDRTGVVTALVLSCMGRSKEYIANDYAVSETELAPMRSRLQAEIVDLFHMCPTFTSAKSDTMIKVLEFIDKEYGSVSNYMEYIGFMKEEQEQLRQNLM